MTPPSTVNLLDVLGVWDRAEGLVAVEHVPGDNGKADAITVFRRTSKGVESLEESFRPYLWATADALPTDAQESMEIRELQGNLPLNRQVALPNWEAYRACVKRLRKDTGKNPTDRDAPFFLINDPVQQVLLSTGRALFGGMVFEDLRRLQLDIETYTSAGYDFPNAEREGDRIIAISLSDSTGWEVVLSGVEYREDELLKEMVRLIRKRDPDVIEGHNLFNFDLPYMAARAKRHKVKLSIGRDGSAPAFRAGRFTAAERALGYTRADIFGRHVVDTYFLAQWYDMTQRALPGYGLKEVAAHLGVSAPDRTRIEGHAIREVFDRDPDRLMAYAADDVRETRAISAILSPIYFTQAQWLPLSYQNVCLRGNAAKIDALLLRRYMQGRHALAQPEAARRFAGGYTDIFFTGIARDVHHCDIQSLYPSLMLARSIEPQSDALHVFLELLDALKRLRFEARAKARSADTEEDRLHWDAEQATCKVLINSFYGYLGFGQARFNDFDAAERIAAEGRELLKHMIDWLKQHHAQPVEIDTDGIYFIPPEFQTKKARADFEKGLQESLPEGINVDFDGEYDAMFSYKMKNYALLDREGRLTLTGAALKSRGLEPFQRRFMEELLRCLLEDRAREAFALKEDYARCIETRQWPIREFAKTETLKESPEQYAAKSREGNRPKSAAYELALASEREYRAGDQISYYVTGSKKSVTVYEAARHIADWDPDDRDENVPYYLGKLNALYNKFKEWIPSGGDTPDLFEGM